MHASTETIECPLCLGVRTLTRSEVLDRLGVKDLARVAQLSAEAIFRLVQRKHSEDSHQVWSRFETELTKRTAEMELRHRSELQVVTVQNGTLTHRLEDYLRESAQLRERTQELEIELSKVARLGRREELDFADEARTWAGICVSEKLPRNGDFILSFRDLSGVPVEPRILIDNKDKAIVGDNDIDKLVRDARERSIPVAVLVARSEDQLRQVDREVDSSRTETCGYCAGPASGFPVIWTCSSPSLNECASMGLISWRKNAAVDDQVRRTFGDIDRIESDLKKAAKAITSVSGLVAKYRSRLQELCDGALGKKMPIGCELSAARVGQ
ncbi:MAG TPA: hypothetical protein VNZ03_00640 [Terriglobales bacterium]|jgi:hypothetical protein|nr:hypothetical protein [Terriglobales bacterium]